MPDDASIAEENRRVWDANAEWWDEQVGPEGNAFHRTLIAPVQMRLLALVQGERVLDIGCGNGQFAREMARAGARVLATDYSDRFLARARAHTDAARAESPLRYQHDIEYRQTDATDEAALLALGEPGSFDAIVSTMVVHTLPEIDQLARAVRTLLADGGRFVFSISHPCFNSTGSTMMTETEDAADGRRTSYSVKVKGYLGLDPKRSTGIDGQPSPAWYFDRAMSELLAPFFAAGFVLDGIEEPAFPPGVGTPGKPPSWTNYPHIPPALVVRLRPARGS